ncbi:MAG: SprT-like domain-containing protein [Gammaproteobacteria bacterium]|nr:SprT-like domain-containing protein [Gammaproteobacteria bacterium]MDA7961787.1 SprT-like domain-containing protein [Gammaproteobacteria bacterium]MDA7970201.1 SprT-like domain-containing protein [Gammaproteobacteria bacterium]MDA7972054.1 SprT-like domain-containing protein [Gammaproteobacteria bacterium]MDA7990010.1 SprT-like domain-containing protein [Gammaproteobacteria bacterium]
MQELDKLKARVSPGDTVRFAYRRRRLRGVVRTLGPRYAGVDADDGEYRVPYELIRPSRAARDHSEAEQNALKQCRQLLRRHGLREWSACLDDSGSRAGACDYRDKTISLSRLFLRAAPPGEVRDTILHEIAHALAGASHHHDARWRRIARGIGCSARLCHDIEFGPPRWIMRCPGGCFALARNRRARGLACMQCGRAPRFLRWNKTLAARFGMPTFE